MKKREFLYKVKNLFKKIFYGGKLPDFIIVGAQKAGTTSIWFNLKKHPQIEMSPNFISRWKNGAKNTKEVHFFDKKYYWGKSWYKRNFNNNGKIQGEVSPDYAINDIFYERMYKVVPNTKLIFVIRDPVARIQSAFNHFKQEKSMMHIDYDPALDFENNFENDKKNNFKNGMVRFGFYINQIEGLLKYYKREQILVLPYEDLLSKPEDFYTKIFKFLGVKNDNTGLNFTEKKHVRKYTYIFSQETKKKLYLIYKPYNERLFKFLGYKINQWINPYEY